MQNNQYNDYGNQYPNQQYPNQQYPQYQQPQYGMPQQQYGAPQNFANNTQLGMTFNIIYAIFLIASGALSVLSGLLLMFQEGGAGSGIFSMLCAVYPILTGIFLIKRMKAGYIMRLINNIFGFISGGFSILTGIMLIAGGGIITAMLEGIEGAELILGILGGLGIGVIIGAIIGIIINILVMKYYGKRKHMFNYSPPTLHNITRKKKKTIFLKTRFGGFFFCPK